MTDHASVWAEITKSEKQNDGTLMVYGKLSDETIDLDQQIADNTWLQEALPEWFKSGGNIREMHTALAAGVATEYEEKPDGHYISAKIVDPGSIKKVEHGVLKGFSIGIKGPRVIRDKAATGGRIVGGKVIEASLADRPANPTCQLVLSKAAQPGEQVVAADFDETRGLVKVEELVEKSPVLDTTINTADPLPMDAVIGEVALPPTVAGDQDCDCCAECTPGCAGDCCAACRLSKPPTAAAQTPNVHSGQTATNGPNSAIKAPEPETPVLEDEVTIDTIAVALKAGSIDPVALRALLDMPPIPEPQAVDDATKTADADLPEVPAPVAEEQSDTVKAAVAEAVKAAVTPLLARLDKVEQMAAPGGPSRTRGKAAEITAHRGDELRNKAAQYRATAKTMDAPDLAKAYIDMAVEAEIELNKLVAG